MDASATNGRGDVVTAQTNSFGAPEHRSKTFVSLKRSGHWFSTTLVETRRWEVLVRLHYHWGDPGDTPKAGYELFRRRDLPPEPCKRREISAGSEVRARPRRRPRRQERAAGFEDPAKIAARISRTRAAAASG